MDWLTPPAFEPHPWVRGGHAQTILGSLLPNRLLAPPATPHFIATKDGDVLCVHEDLPERRCQHQPPVLLIHGLGGCHRSYYVARLAERLRRNGRTVFRMDMRGWGAGAHLARSHTHAGRWDDVQSVVEFCLEQTGRSLAIVGFSMGANQVLSFLGRGDRHLTSRIDRAIAIAPPVRLDLCAAKLNHGLNRIYDASFVKTLRRQAQHRRRSVPGFREIRGVPFPDRLRAIDARWTAPLGGFRDRDQYYELCSSAQDLIAIERPTLILAAEDDPIVPIQSFDGLATSPQVTVMRTRTGGHLGYVAKPGRDPDPRWLDWRLLEWLAPSPIKIETRRIPAPKFLRKACPVTAEALP